jgi:hypothetical protein
MILQIEQRHIDTAIAKWRHGPYNVTCDCPIALATKENFSGKAISVGYYLLSVDGVDYNLDNYRHKMHKFDSEKIMEPFTIELL